MMRRVMIAIQTIRRPYNRLTSGDDRRRDFGWMTVNGRTIGEIISLIAPSKRLVHSSMPHTVLTLNCQIKVLPSSSPLN